MSTENEATRDELPVINAEIVRYQPTGESLAVVREPEQVLADAQKAAAALMKVVSGKKKQVTFNGETYLESGDWQTVAKFYGVTAKIESTKFVTFGEASGFEAAAVALDCNGREVSRGEAMCLNDEENWGMRPKYEWQDVLDAQGNKIWEPNPNKPGKNRPKSKKVQVGETPTPLFQLRSMAQTRACAKALSNLFKWVVVLAGYKPTPAEEMTGQERGVQNSSVDPDFEPDLPSESDAISHQPTGAAQAPPVAQPPTTRPAASPAASQPQVGVLKFIPPNGLTTVIKGVKEIAAVAEQEARIDEHGVVIEAARKASKAYMIVNFLGQHKGVGFASCFDTKFWPLLKESIGLECHFQIKEADKGGSHFINIVDVLFVDGQPYLDGKLVVEGAK